MEIILREDIEKLGHRGDVVKVAPGFARNFLIPRKLAVLANDSNRKIVAQERDAWLRKEAKLKNESEDLAKMLSAVTLTISQRAGEDGHLFGSVTSKDVAELLEKQGYQIDRKKVVLEEHIRQTGEYKIPVRLHREVTAEVTLNVVAEAQ
ncbi:MAG: 50S ribosomal protein L9 [Bryobacteraceae bacterium]|nr:50S ribosomal protein L9 [Bryobacteraceae bacterium]